MFSSEDLDRMASELAELVKRPVTDEEREQVRRRPAPYSPGRRAYVLFPRAKSLDDSLDDSTK